MPYITYPNSYIMLVKDSCNKIGYIVIINKEIDDARFLQATDYNSALKEIKVIQKRDKKIKNLPVYRDITKKYSKLFKEFYS